MKQFAGASAADSIRDFSPVSVAAAMPMLLLSHPGINVVSAAEVGGECGPIQNYACPKAITGRAGLFPSRYQSDKVDRGGNLSRFRNAKMRAAFLLAADNLVKCNEYWRGKYNLWKSQGHDPRDLRCRVANRFTRTVFQMIAGRKIYQHRSRLDRGYIMQKLLEFLRDRQTPAATILTILKDAADQLPATAAGTVQKYARTSPSTSVRSGGQSPMPNWKASTRVPGLRARIFGRSLRFISDSRYIEITVASPRS